jgi:omega-6 fatty acid desaturase (delta-12 desaturase)
LLLAAADNGGSARLMLELSPVTIVAFDVLAAGCWCLLMSVAPSIDLKAANIRATIPASARVRSTGKGLFLFALGVGLYLGSVLATVLAPWWPLKLVFSLSSAFFLATLFVIGHDACHEAFVPYRWLNAVLGRIAFLPSWHSYAGWEHAHNHVHHVWTNLRQKDYVWAPLCKEAYDRLPAWRRALERFYRSLPGLGMYYFSQIYLRRIMFPSQQYRGHKTIGRFLADNLLVAAFIAAQAAVLIYASSWYGRPCPAVESLIFGQWLPFVVWNWLIGFLILLHHTHPRIPWFDNPQEWSFYRGQIQGTAHVVFPGPVNWFIHYIMEHTAHHVDAHIPLYHLVEAQASLRAAFGGDIVEHRFSIRSFRYLLKVCQLYDYSSHRWMNWAGKLTSSSTIESTAEVGGAKA